MKRFLLLLMSILLTGGTLLQAEPVSESRAREIAMKVLAAQPATKAASGDVKLIWNGEEAATKAAAQPAFYVFGRDGGGFVIVAGDDNVQPVLAISETNEFKVEGMPENVKWWMDNMKYYVRNMLPTQQVREQWAQFAETKSGPLPETVTDKHEKLTATWDQGNADLVYYKQRVFNKFCPTVTSGEPAKTDTCITGCVAVALGEVITYQSGQAGVTMPTKGTGNVGGYSVDDGYVAPAVYALGTTYDWANLRTLMTRQDIKDAITAGKTDLLNNLARLLADLGAMAQANYSPTGTGASTNNAISGLMTHMGFNKSAYLDLASRHSPREWITMLKEELDERPFIYSGQTAGNAGHSFVFDGYGKYMGDDVFHVNFGWSGSNNGYYYFTNLDAGGGHDYSYVGEAFFDFYPNPTSTYPTILKMIVSDSENPRDGMKYSSSAPVKKGDPVLIGTFYVKNMGGAVYAGQVRLVAIDKSGNVKQVFQQFGFSAPGLRPGYYSGIYFDAGDALTVDYDFALGDKIILQYTTDESVWAKIESATSPSALIDELPLMPASFIKTESEYHIGDYFQFRLMNNDIKYMDTDWTITRMDDGTSVVRNQSDWEYQFTQTGTYKIEAAVKATVGGALVETITTYITVN